MKYAPVLYWKAPCMFWPSLFGLCRFIFHGFFLGPPVCFLQFCMVLPSLLHSLRRLNGLERGVCHLSVTLPFSRSVHLFWPSLLACAAPFSMVFSWVLQCFFFNFAWSCLHFCIAFPDLMVLREVCAILVWTPSLRDVHLFWPSLLACATPVSMVFSWVLQCVFYNFASSCLYFCIEQDFLWKGSSGWKGSWAARSPGPLSPRGPLSKKILP